MLPKHITGDGNTTCLIICKYVFMTTIRIERSKKNQAAVSLIRFFSISDNQDNGQLQFIAKNILNSQLD